MQEWRNWNTHLLQKQNPEGSVSAPLQSALNEGPLDLQRPVMPICPRRNVSTELMPLIEKGIYRIHFANEKEIRYNNKKGTL